MVVLILLLLEHKSDKRKFALAIVLTGVVIMNHTVSIIFIRRFCCSSTFCTVSS